MNSKLKKWIIDTVEADMRSSYRRAQDLPLSMNSWIVMPTSMSICLPECSIS